jgi:predicted outer membrane repeat protein
MCQTLRAALAEVGVSYPSQASTITFHPDITTVTIAGDIDLPGAGSVPPLVRTAWFTVSGARPGSGRVKITADATALAGAPPVLRFASHGATAVFENLDLFELRFLVTDGTLSFADCALAADVARVTPQPAIRADGTTAGTTAAVALARTTISGFRTYDTSTLTGVRPEGGAVLLENAALTATGVRGPVGSRSSGRRAGPAGARPPQPPPPHLSALRCGGARQCRAPRRAWTHRCMHAVPCFPPPPTAASPTPFYNPSRPCRPDTLFESNEASFGGAVAATGGSSVNCARCELAANKATVGGAVYAVNSAATFSSCSFKYNGAVTDAQAGGAVYSNGAALTLDRSLVLGNTASAGGGVYGFDLPSFTATNTIFALNSASSTGFGGAAVYLFGSVTATLTACTLTGNTGAPGYKQDASGVGAPTTVASSCIFDDAPPLDTGRPGSGSTITVTSSLVRGGTAVCSLAGINCPLGGIIDGDPALVQLNRTLPPSTRGPDTYWAPTAASPGNRKGNVAGAGAVDFLGNPRVRTGPACGGRGGWVPGRGSLGHGMGRYAAPRRGAPQPPCAPAHTA